LQGKACQVNVFVGAFLVERTGFFRVQVAQACSGCFAEEGLIRADDLLILLEPMGEPLA
jgi:hypothetical protein